MSHLVVRISHLGAVKRYETWLRMTSGSEVLTRKARLLPSQLHIYIVIDVTEVAPELTQSAELSRTA